jgi:N6-L-threonylcarbamoyladenine synthase
MTVLALETSCDETAVAVLRDGEVVASEVASQILLHRPYGGVVPELASRNHLAALRPTLEAAMAAAGLGMEQIDAFAATSGPGLASSLLVGNTAAKAMALAAGKPFVAVNHMEGHLLSPFLGRTQGIFPCMSLIVSGGHTMLVALRAAGDYEVLGRTRDDAAGEAFDKVGKMLGLPYPGGPEVEKAAASGPGDPVAWQFPRSMLDCGYEFSFSGLKTAVLYEVRKLDPADRDTWLADICASFQQAVIDVLVAKTLRAAREQGFAAVGLSGGVSCNRALRGAFAAACSGAGLDFHVASPEWTTDNAAMIGFAAEHLLARGITSSLDEDVDPNLPLGGVS